MKILSTRSASDAHALDKLNRRYAPGLDVEKLVAGILTQVRNRGDAALVELALKFDHVDLTPESLRVGPAKVPDPSDAALVASHANVLAFAKRGLRQDWRMTNAQGAEVGEIYQPFSRVGIYVPGGGAPLVSTVLMTATLAQAAGCEEIVVCTPCGKDGELHPQMLAALKLCGATEIYRIGGAQAIAAMAYGTETIRPVDKIFGPGNKYVVEAKRQVFGTVAIDLLPGPSEIMVLCDDTANPAYVAADLLAQAEHGHDGEIILVSNSPAVIAAVHQEMEKQFATLPRAEIIRETIEHRAWLVETADLDEGITICNRYAPEHLSLIVEDEAAAIRKIRNAGAIFLGNYSPVATGDFVAGPSHTLPTGGAGKSFSGLTVDQFQRRTSIVKFDRAALAKTAPLVVRFGDIESLDAHSRTATIRLQ
ncbi:MAG: histidinol dehydrogenase [Verrucomicrobiota bacterium]|jgi:histidinol dehydrogenase